MATDLATLLWAAVDNPDPRPRELADQPPADRAGMARAGGSFSCVGEFVAILNPNAG